MPLKQLMDDTYLKTEWLDFNKEATLSSDIKEVNAGVWRLPTTQINLVTLFQRRQH
jgi:hypothetical protein